MFEEQSKTKPGTIYTFYSYKGGVGRSMALVNVGVLLASEGKRVLLVDWDLEAPGLEVYFQSFKNSQRTMQAQPQSPGLATQTFLSVDRNARLVGDPAEVPGIVDLLEARVSERDLPWKQCLLRAEFLGQSLDIISAGSKTNDYRKRIQQLDWDSLYKEHNVGNFVNQLREEWRASYDFVLVDSRTGVTDIGDICTVLLPDAIVLMFVSNYQNIDGIKSVMARAEKARKSLPVNRTKLHGIPIPARAEVYAEYGKSEVWMDIFAQEFSDLYKEWLPRAVSPKDATQKLFIPYVTNWSFGERIPVLENAREAQDPTTIGAAYRRLANLLANNLDWYSLESEVKVEQLQGAQLALQQERVKANTLAEEGMEKVVGLSRKVARWQGLTFVAAVVSIFATLSIFATNDAKLTELLQPLFRRTDSSASRLPDFPPLSTDIGVFFAKGTKWVRLLDERVTWSGQYSIIGTVLNETSRMLLSNSSKPKNPGSPENTLELAINAPTGFIETFHLIAFTVGKGVRTVNIGNGTLADAAHNSIDFKIDRFASDQFVITLPGGLAPGQYGIYSARSVGQERIGKIYTFEVQ